MYDESRLDKVWDRANRLFEDGVLYFVDELPINTEDNIELGMIKNTHEWEYLTPNVLEIVGEIVQGNLKRQERWEACQLLHTKTLRYSIMFIFLYFRRTRFNNLRIAFYMDLKGN